MRTRLALLLVLPRDADLLLLDEPTAGLAPAAIEEVLGLLAEYVAAEGRTVFFSSHQIAEVEQIAAHARALKAVAVEVVPVTLKEIFLEGVKPSGGE
jgi:ABC-type multidrug transport system ATPase subunit